MPHKKSLKSALSAFELCAGGGGQALGVELAGFSCAGAAEIEAHACATLLLNRPEWNVILGDIRTIEGRNFRGTDLVAGGVPCPPFSVAGKQLGADDERDLFPEALRIIEGANPPAVMLENVAGFASAKFSEYRRDLFQSLEKLGYRAEWQLINACDFGVPQLRPRVLIVAMKKRFFKNFAWPIPTGMGATVGETLKELMSANDWPGVMPWVARANGIAPTLVGGSKKHGGPDLGPTRARAKWLELGVDGLGIADSAPAKSFAVNGLPRLTVRMAAKIQSFPDDWQFSGKKTASYRQVGNALPPLVAKAVASAIRLALEGSRNASNPSLCLTKNPFDYPKILQPHVKKAPNKNSSTSYSRTLAG